MAKAQYLQTALLEHPFNFLNPEEESNRKIYWYGLPANIKIGGNHKWEVQIIPDYTVGIDKDSWWNELANRESNVGEIKDDDGIPMEDYHGENKYNNSINWGDAFSDAHINWFRKN